MTIVADDTPPSTQSRSLSGSILTSILSCRGDRPSRVVQEMLPDAEHDTNVYPNTGYSAIIGWPG